MGEPETRAERQERGQELLQELPAALKAAAEGVPLDELLAWPPAAERVQGALDELVDVLRCWERTGAQEDAEELHRAGQDLAHTCGIAGLLLRRRHVRAGANTDGANEGRPPWR